MIDKIVLDVGASFLRRCESGLLPIPGDLELKREYFTDLVQAKVQE